MKNKLLFLIISLSAFQLYSQNNSIEEIQAYIAEHGISSPVHFSEADNNFFEINTNWASLPDAPAVFGRSIGGVIGDYIYIFGGQNNPSLALAFHIPSNVWSNSTPANSSAYNAGFCVANNELYKISGTGAASVFEKFTPNGTGTGVWTSLTAGPSAVMNAQNSMIWDGGDYIYVNTATFATPPVPSFARYRISTNTWENMPVSIIGRKYAGMACLNDEIYLIGGLTETGGDGTICQKYNIASQTWSLIAPLPEPVTFTKWTVTADNNYVYLIGAGGGYLDFPIVDKVYYYNPLTNTWTLESTLPALRGLALGFLMEGFYKLFFGGGNDGTSGTAYQNDTWEGTGGPYIPVELTSFSASVADYTVILSWTTASEINNSHFEVERSIDNQNFSVIGNVSGKGTTTEINSYSFTDNSISESKYFYRLKQVDFDGSFEYSDVIEIDINITDYVLHQNYPNPFNPTTTISWQSPVGSWQTLKVYDILGNEIDVLVNENKEPGIYTINFNAQNLTSGIYFYELTAGNFREVKKFTLIR
jgi:hypothetical protein